MRGGALDELTLRLAVAVDVGAIRDVLSVPKT
jgi:hypothetical protein